MLTAMSLSGMTPKQVLDVENITKDNCVNYIQNILIETGDVEYSLTDAEKIYEYFASKSKEFLIYEFMISLAEDDNYNFSALAADILED
jgi:hypothetical protein